MVSWDHWCGGPGSETLWQALPSSVLKNRRPLRRRLGRSMGFEPSSLPPGLPCLLLFVPLGPYRVQVSVSWQAGKWPKEQIAPVPARRLPGLPSIGSLHKYLLSIFQVPGPVANTGDVTGGKQTRSSPS